MFKITNASDPTNVTLSSACPSDSTFNSTKSYIEVGDIYAPNAYPTIEDDHSKAGAGIHIGGISTDDIPFTGFTIPSDCYIEEITIDIYTDATATDIDIRIYNSTWNSGQERNEPVTPTGGYVTVVSGASITSYNDWYTFSITKTLLKSSYTDNNTFFIYVRDNEFSDTQWFYAKDDSNGDNDDEEDVYHYNAGYINYTITSSAIDMSLKLKLSPLNNTANPEDIGMQINNTIINGYQNINGSGYWNYERELSALPSQLSYDVSANWYNVSCNITKIQVNYTRTDLIAGVHFNIPSSGVSIEWNVTRTGGFYGFQSGFSHYYINYTISSFWYNVEVWNGGTQKTDIFTRNLGNGYNETRVLGGENGTYWYLKANSDNMLQSIDLYDINANSINAANFSDTVYINATFDTILNSAVGNDQGVNLSIYNPEALNNLLNYTNINSTFDKDEIDLGDWDIGTNITQYGDFRIQVFWSNDTAAGFREEILTVFGETELQPTLPNDVFDASDTFDITVYFNDTKQNLPIIGADINYSINGNTKRYDNVVDENNGNYTITIVCNDSEFEDSGVNSVMVNASKQYYNNDTKIVEFTILGETKLTTVKPPRRLWSGRNRC